MVIIGTFIAYDPSKTRKKIMKFALFWDFKQRRMLVSYGRLGTNKGQGLSQ